MNSFVVCSCDECRGSDSPLCIFGLMTAEDGTARARKKGGVTTKWNAILRHEREAFLSAEFL